VADDSIPGMIQSESPSSHHTLQNTTVTTMAKTSVEIRFAEKDKLGKCREGVQTLQEARRISELDSRKANGTSPTLPMESLDLRGRTSLWRAHESRKSLEKRLDDERRGRLAEPWASWPPPGYDKWGPRLDEKNGEDSREFRDDSEAHRDLTNTKIDQPEGKEGGRARDSEDEIVPVAPWESEAVRLGIRKGNEKQRPLNQFGLDRPRFDDKTAAQGVLESIDIEAKTKRKLGVSFKDRVRGVFSRFPRTTEKSGHESKESSLLAADLEQDHLLSIPNTSSTSSRSFHAVEGSQRFDLQDSQSRDVSPDQDSSGSKGSSSKMTFRGRVEKYD
jgi:hypothetical protein